MMRAPPTIRALRATNGLEEHVVQASDSRIAGPVDPSRGGMRVADPDLDAILGDLTHAVVNVLNTIAAASELATLLIARGEAAGAASPLANIEDECIRAARLLRAGREFIAWPVRSRSDPVDIASLLHECAGTFEGRVAVAGGDDVPAVCGDARALRRACMEILGNAFQSGARRVNVVLEHEPDDAEVRIGFYDDGPGITASAARVFEPFFTTRPVERDGLGLALVARIATAHGGSAGLDKVPNGAAVWIRLPVRAA